MPNVKTKNLCPIIFLISLLVTLLTDFNGEMDHPVQVEAVLNSRPICPFSDDSNDFVPLTPAQFLVATPLGALSDTDIREIPASRLTRFQHIQQCQRHFWSRWYKHYIAKLQQWTKRKIKQADLKIGAVVLTKEGNAPPLCWRLKGEYLLHPGACWEHINLAHKCVLI